MGGKIGRTYSNRPSNIILPNAVNLSRQTIKTWKSAIEAAKDPEEPNRSELMEVYDSIMGDDHLESIIETRILKVVHSKFKLVDNAGDENKELTKLFSKKWFKETKKNYMAAKFWGASVLEFWELTEDMHLKTCEVIPRENCNFKKGFFTREVGDDKGVYYKSGSYANYYLQVGKDDDLGILEKAAPAAISKKFALGAWLELCEKYGIPPRYATTDSFSQTRHQELANMLAKMVSSHYAVLQGNEKIEMLNGINGDPHKVFDGLIQRLEWGMSKRVLGHDSAAGTKDSKGTFGSLKILQDVANDRHKSDKEDFLNWVNDELIPLLKTLSPVYSVLEGYTFAWDDFKELSAQDTIEAVVKLENAGHQVDSEFITQKTGIPIIGRKEIVKQEDPEKKKPELKAFHSALNTIYTPFKSDLNPQASTDDLLKHFDDFTRQVYYSKKDIKTPFNLCLAIANKLSGVLVSDPVIQAKALERAFYAHLKNSIFVFSIAKTFAQYQELSALLLDDDGKKRDWQSFKDKATDIHKTYNINYLRTEYITAGRSAKLASKWQRFEKQKDLYDLRYETSQDNKVRKAHRELHGITRPVDDAFWDTFYPPLDWNCRCTVRQVAKGSKITPADKLKTLKKPGKQFQLNSGKKKLIFSNSHPYITLFTSQIKQELQAVRDYGLKSVDEIYARGKNIAPVIKEQTKDQANTWWENLSKSKDVNFRANIGKDAHRVVLSDKQFKQITKDTKAGNHRYIHQLPHVLRSPNEVYFRSKQGIYKFIKYYQDKILIVNVKMSDDAFTVKAIYQVNERKLLDERSGILMTTK